MFFIGWRADWQISYVSNSLSNILHVLHLRMSGCEGSCVNFVNINPFPISFYLRSGGDGDVGDGGGGDQWLSDERETWWRWVTSPLSHSNRCRKGRDRESVTHERMTVRTELDPLSKQLLGLRCHTCSPSALSPFVGRNTAKLTEAASITTISCHLDRWQLINQLCYILLDYYC